MRVPPSLASTRRLVALLVAATTAIGCHQVLIRIERRSSAGVPDTGGIRPRRFFDGHYLPLPAKPFINCFDVVSGSKSDETCRQSPDLPVQFTGYSPELIPRPFFDVAPAWLRSTSATALVAGLDRIAGTFVPGWTSPQGAIVTVGDVRSEPWSADPRDRRRLYFAALPADAVPADAMPSTVRFRVGQVGPWQLGGLVDAPGATLITENVALGKGDRIELAIGYGAPRPLFSFIHLSDAQIREPEATLGGPQVSETLDPLIESFAHDYEQELYSSFFYEAIIRTINDEILAAQCDLGGQQLHPACRPTAAHHDQPGPLPPPLATALARVRGGAYRIAPSIAVHTGDAIDAGLVSEFREFLNRTDLLRIPWYSVVGNHDILGFGNLDVESSGKDYVCTPVTTMLREYYLQPPTIEKNGDDETGHEVYSRRPRAKWFSLAPIGVRKVCLGLDVRGDRLLAQRSVTDGLTGADLFIEAHCRSTELQSQVPDGKEALSSQTAPAPAGGSPLDTPLRRLLKAGSTRPEAAAAQVQGHGATHVRAVVGSDCRAHLQEPVVAASPAESSQETPAPGPVTPPPDAPDAPDAARQADEHPEGLEPPPPGYYAGSSRLNGFDLNPSLAGYYAFPTATLRLAGRQRNLWVVVLNTSAEKGAFGEICRRDERADNGCRQLAWLTNVLHERMKAEDIALVFGHHPLWGIDDAGDRKALTDLLARSNVPAYFAGHTHSPKLRAVKVGGKSRFWEVIASSTIAYPQQARQVTLKDVPGSDLAYLEVLTFEPHLGGLEQTYVNRAMRGAERDACHSKPDDCLEGRPRAPASHLVYPRLFFRVGDRPAHGQPGGQPGGQP